MASIKLLDPTKTEFSGNTDYQNLFIYVDMTATRKGNTVLNRDNDNITTNEGINVNLMGYNQDKINTSKIYTSDYTKIYNDDNIYEGFGITSINIETNSSYVPKINIEFVDIKGMSFFNKGKSSPYSILFDFPPPIFNLKIKGYYGKTLEYKLHLIRHNTKFESDTGNYYINAEFIGNTFAPLTDILFQNVLMVSKLDETPVNVNGTGNVNSLADLVAKSKVLINDVIEKTLNSDEYKQIEKDNETLTEYIEAFNNKLNDLNDDLFIVRVDKTKLNILLLKNEYQILKSGTKLNDLTNTNKFEYFIVEKQLSVNSFRKGEEIKILFNRLFSSFSLEPDNIFIDKNSILLNQIPIKIENISDINYLNITESIKEANKIKNDLNTRYNNEFKSLENTVEEDITKELGFRPTVKNVIEIIANDIDRWVESLSNVYNDSRSYISNNKNRVLKYYNNNTGEVDKVYPFPDFIENNKKTIPSASDLDMPEIKFTDNFIKKFIDYKNEIARDNRLQNSLITTDNNENIWFPINTNDSTYLHKYNFKFPYNNIKNYKDIFNELFARLYIYNYYSQGFLIKNNFFRLRYFFDNEEDVILNLITEDKILKSFKDELKKLNNIDKFLNYLYFNEISNRITNIINNLKIDSENFSGIEFTNKDIILNTNINENLLENNFYTPIITFFGGGYNIAQIDSNDFGFTINDTNNIVYYDGGVNNPETSFVSITQTNNKIFKDIISSSLNLGLKFNEDEKKYNNISTDKIDITPDINDRIYDYYINYNNPDNYKKGYGIFNILYVPNENIGLLFDTTTIVQLPIFVKAYISSLVYGLNTENVLIADPDYFITNNNNYINLINESDNKDYIHILYNNNYIRRNSTSRNKIIENRQYILDKLRNLSEKDKNKYITYYKNFIDDNYNDLITFISSLLDENNKFNTIENKYTNINTENIEYLFDKTVIINNSLYTYNNKESFNNLFTENNIRENLKNIYNTIFKDQINGFFKTLINRINDKPNVNQKDDNMGLQDVRIETYYSFKNFVDRWFTLNEEDDNISNNSLFDGSLIELFSFVDRASNKARGEDIIIDFTILQEFENDYNINMLTVIGKLLNENGFEFFPLQNFINFQDDTWDESIFTPLTNSVNISDFKPRFTCMYVGGGSKYLDSGFNSNSTFKDDGIIDITTAPDINDSDDAYGFRVRFGDGKQSLFMNIDLNTEEFQPTNESLKAMSLILDNNDKPAVPIAQNLYSTYEQRSYTCKIKMMGNAMIQPTQFFMLENIPMFSGLYLILKVNHTIDGETNSMYTEFEGIRLPKEPRRFITNSFDQYVKRFLNSNLIIPDISSSSVDVEVLNDNEIFNKEERTIHLISGHNNNDTGAIRDDGVTEHSLTKDFKELLKTELDTLSINNTTDDDNDNLTTVINKLNEIVKPNDIVLDIHFNAFQDPRATGTEIFIKDSTDEDVINIGKNIVDIVSNTLNIDLRKISTTNNKLPAGVKIQSSSQYRNLAIFSINAKVLLLEICFITNKNDYNSYIDNKKILANNIAKLLSNTAISDNDIRLRSVKTFNILNNLKYDGILNRSNPYVIENKYITEFNNLIPINDFTFNASGSGFGFTSKFQNGVKYTANILKNYYTNFQTYKDDIRSQINLTSNNHKIDWLFLSGLIYIESRFNPVAISKTGAFGIGQFILSSGLLEILIILNGNKNKTSDVIIYDSNLNNYSNKTISYGDMINILFNNNIIDINSLSSNNINNLLNNNKLMGILINSIFNNPFLCIELIGIYLNRLQSYVNTTENKNLGILALSYNTGNYINKEISDTPYFTHIINYYNSERTSEDIRKKLVGKINNEGIKYPERLLNEYISKFINLDLTKSSLV